MTHLTAKLDMFISQLPKHVLHAIQTATCVIPMAKRSVMQAIARVATSMFQQLRRVVNVTLNAPSVLPMEPVYVMDSNIVLLQATCM